ncbi:MAG: hypothetical protein YK1312THETA_1930006 [Marine Group I thaumarchaeote]|nr:MAG: hypothetical protein YK1312THETA_1930006 [Marine Group I thaumarchaeote]
MKLFQIISADIVILLPKLKENYTIIKLLVKKRIVTLKILNSDNRFIFL